MRLTDESIRGREVDDDGAFVEGMVIHSPKEVSRCERTIKIKAFKQGGAHCDPQNRQMGSGGEVSQPDFQ